MKHHKKPIKALQSPGRLTLIRSHGQENTRLEENASQEPAQFYCKQDQEDFKIHLAFLRSLPDWIVDTEGFDIVAAEAEFRRTLAERAAYECDDQQAVIDRFDTEQDLLGWI